MQATEIQWKLKSKLDFLQYLDKHREYRYTFDLTPLQFSTTFHQLTPSIKISSKQCLQSRSSYSEKNRCSLYKYPNMMSWAWRHCGLSLSMTQTSQSIFQMSFLKVRVHHVSTSSTFSIQCNQTFSSRCSSTQTSSVWPSKERKVCQSRSRSHSSGRSS